MKLSGGPELCLNPADMYKNRLLGSVPCIAQIKYQKQPQPQHYDDIWIERNKGIEIDNKDIIRLKKV